MNSVLELCQSIDLSPHGVALLQLVETADPVLPALILSIPTLLGAKMAGPYPLLRNWGLRLAAAVFVVYFGYAGFAHGGFDTQRLPHSALRALVAAELLLAPLWIVAPVVLFVYGRLRLVLAAFLLYLGYAWFTADSLTSENLPTLALQASVAAALVLLVAWILQPITDFVAARVRHRFPLRDRTDAVPCAEPAPLAAKQKQKLRRQRARLKLELCYARHEAQIGAALPRGVFDSFVGRYLGDHLAADEVEEYAHELEVIIFQHVNNPPPIPVRPINVDDLSQWFHDDQRFDAQEPDSKRKRTKLAGLTRRPTQLADEVREN